MNSDTPELAEQHKDFADLDLVRDYCSEGYRRFTRVLLQEKGETPVNSRFESVNKRTRLFVLTSSDELQDIILKAPRLQRPITLFRGQGEGDYLKGCTAYTFWNFTAATSQEQVAESFGPENALNGKGFYIEFPCPIGFPMLHTGGAASNRREYEYIFPKGTTVEIIKVKQKPIQLHHGMSYHVPVYVCVPTFLDKYSRASRKRIKR